MKLSHKKDTCRNKDKLKITSIVERKKESKEEKGRSSPIILPIYNGTNMAKKVRIIEIPNMMEWNRDMWCQMEKILKLQNIGPALIQISCTNSTNHITDPNGICNACVFIAVQPTATKK